MRCFIFICIFFAKFSLSHVFDVTLRKSLDDSLMHLKRARRHEQFDALRYNILLQHLNIGINQTNLNEKRIIARAYGSGNLFLLDGDSITRVMILNNQVHLQDIAKCDDINGGVTEFEVEEVKMPTNKSFLIASMYIKDRFQIYRITINDTSNANLKIKSIQKIARPGRSTKTFLLQHMQNLYLITAHLEYDSGKIAIYRWLNYHFSVEDIKDVPYHNEIVIHSQKHLVILVLNTAIYPQRSINHVYILNENRKMVKTQEMFFLFRRLPYYQIKGELYILRCLAFDNCFLYKWNDEKLFIRVSKIALDPRNIHLFNAGFNLQILALETNFYFYYNQPLLKAASTYILTDKHGNIVDDVLLTDSYVSNIYIYKESMSDKMYLVVLYNDNKRLAKFFGIQFLFQRTTSVEAKDETSKFNVLKICLTQIKEIMNIRKSWTDVLKYQISRTFNKCNQIEFIKSLTTPSVLLTSTNTINNIVVSGFSKYTPRSLFEQWIISRLSLNHLHLYDNALLYVDKNNAIYSNVKIEGSVYSKHTQMNNMKMMSYGTPIENVRERQKRQNVQALHSMERPKIIANDVVSNEIFLSNTLSRNDSNQILYGMEINILNAYSIHPLKRHINDIVIAKFSTSLMQSLKTGYKTFHSISAKTINLSYVNHKLLLNQFSNVQNFRLSTSATKTFSISGVRQTNSVFINNYINGMVIANFLQQVYFWGKNPTVRGNIYVNIPSHVRNVQTKAIDKFRIMDIFNLKINQNITSVIHMQKLNAASVEASQINGLYINENASRIGAAHNIYSAEASNFVILKDLILSTDEDVSVHVLGSNIEDFSQSYLGRIYLKGALICNTLFLNTNSMLLADSFLVVHTVQNYYWMKNIKQNITTFSFQEFIQFNNLICNEMNYSPIFTYVLTHNRSPYVALKMFEAHIPSIKKTYVKYPCIVHYIVAESVFRSSILTKVSDQKRFTGLVYIGTLVADLVDLSSMDNLITEIESQVPIGNYNEITHLKLDRCNVNLIGNINIRTYMSRSFGNLINDSVSLLYFNHTISYTSIVDLTLQNLQALVINVANFNSSVPDVSNLLLHNNHNANFFKLNSVFAINNVISTNKLLAKHVNSININEYIPLLATKTYDQIQHLAIGGIKYISNSVTLHGKVSIVFIDKIHINNLIINTTRKSISQDIVGLWSTKTLKCQYFAARTINDMLIKHLVNSNLHDFNIYRNLVANFLVIAENASGHATPNISCITKPTKVKYIAQFQTHDSMLLKEKYRTLLFDVMNSSLTFDRDTVIKKVVFYGGNLAIYYLRNDIGVIRRANNLLPLIANSIKRNHSIVIYHDICSLSTAMFQNINLNNHLIHSTTINKINLHSLNQNIHSLVYDPVLLKCIKKFEYQVHIMALNVDGELSSNIYASNIFNHSSDEKKAQYRFMSTVIVVGNIITGTINKLLLHSFLKDKMEKNQTDISMHSSQHVSNVFVFSILMFSSIHNSIQSINRIAPREMIFLSSNEHQIIVKRKNIKGKVSLIGPTSVIQFEKYHILATFKMSFMIGSYDVFLTKSQFTSDVLLKTGIRVGQALNDIPSHNIVMLKLSATESFIPLMGVIQKQIMTYDITKHESIHVNYRKIFSGAKNTQKYNSNNSVGHLIPAMHNHIPPKILFKQSSIDGKKIIDLKIITDEKESKFTIFGTLIQAEWKEISREDNNTTLLVLALMDKNAQTVLNIHIYQDEKLKLHQSIQLQSSAPSFKMIWASSSTSVLIIRDLIEIKPKAYTLAYDVYSYDSNNMKFIFCKTLNGDYNLIEEISINEMVMIILSEKKTNVLSIFAVKRTICSLYQKIIFNANIISVSKVRLTDVPALKIITEDNAFFICIYTSLEGWKHQAYGRLTSQLFTDNGELVEVL